MTDQSHNDSLFDFLGKTSTFLMANLLWVLLSLPLITMPAVTAGLFATFSRWVRGKDVEVFNIYWEATRQYWRKSTVIFVLDLIIGGLIITNFSIFPIMQKGNPLLFLSQSITISVTLMTLIVNLYLWPLMVMSDMPLKALLITAVRLAVGHLIWSIFMLIVVLSFVTVSLFLPAPILLLVTFSSCALFINWGAWRVIRRYIPEQERLQLEVVKSLK